MNDFEVDAARWPLLVCRFPRSREREVIEAYYEAWVALSPRGKHAVVIDLSEMRPLGVTAKDRRLVAEVVERHRAFFERNVVAEARIVPHSLTRSIVTAFDWMVGSTFSHPIRKVESMTAAEEWALAILRERGLSR